MTPPDTTTLNLVLTGFAKDIAPFDLFCASRVSSSAGVGGACGMGLQVARSTPARRAAVGRDSDRAGHSDGLRSALCRAMDRQPIRPRRTPVVGEQVTRLQAVRTYYLPGRRKCPADAGDVVRERPPGLGRDRGVEPALSPKTVAAAAIQSSTRSQLNGKPILQADAPRMPLIKLRFRCSNCGSRLTDWVVTAKKTGPRGRRRAMP